MKLSNETKLYLKVIALKKKSRHQQEVMSDILKLERMVAPAFVYHVSEIKENVHPSLSAFATSHGYNIPRFLRLLRKEEILSKVHGTWVLAPQYKDMGLVFYTIGNHFKYSSLDMFLLPDGVKFMERFMAAHPVKGSDKPGEGTSL